MLGFRQRQSIRLSRPGWALEFDPTFPLVQILEVRARTPPTHLWTFSGISEQLDLRHRRPVEYPEDLRDSVMFTGQPCL